MVVHHISRNNHPENPVDPVGIGYWVLCLPRLPYEIPAEGEAHFIRVKVCDHYFTGVRDVGFWYNAENMEKAKETMEILAGIANKSGRVTANYITFTGHVHTPIVRGKL